jgi:hypothetical protein
MLGAGRGTNAGRGTGTGVGASAGKNGREKLKTIEKTIYSFALNFVASSALNIKYMFT